MLDKTPFYGEGGGQVGDTGVLTSDAPALLAVNDTKKTDGVYLHLATVANGVLRVGDTVKAEVDDARRTAIMRNHSACHLLQAALRRVLGNHVEQAGSYVDMNRCRFDFTHFAALSAEELSQVESIVNESILAGLTITMQEMPIEEAKKLGAMMLFGEKYGDVVRVVRMGDCSTEFCGGTHMDNTARIGLFKILSESSVAAGVRRIEAVTGLGVLTLIRHHEETIASAAKELKAANPEDLVKRATAVNAEIHDAKKEIEALNAKVASANFDSLKNSAVDVGGVKLLASHIPGMPVQIARSLCDKVKAESSDTACILAVSDGGKLNFVAVCGKDAVSRGAHAGKLVAEVAKVTGGKGGGRPDSAMAGGVDLSKIDEALAVAKDVLLSMLKA